MTASLMNCLPPCDAHHSHILFAGPLLRCPSFPNSGMKELSNTAHHSKTRTIPYKNDVPRPPVRLMPRPPPTPYDQGGRRQSWPTNTPASSASHFVFCRSLGAISGDRLEIKGADEGGHFPRYREKGLIRQFQSRLHAHQTTST
jgi:hypothetical protein